MIHVVELTFSDDPARLAARPAHRDRLLRLHAAGELLMAGPWGDDSGAQLIFRADRARLDEIIAGDPYYRTDGVRIGSIREWRPVVGDSGPG
jgi:uncharacterized protein YciI